MIIERTSEFKSWFDRQPEKAKAQIDARLKNIELYSYFGDHKSLDEGLLPPISGNLSHRNLNK